MENVAWDSNGDGTKPTADQNALWAGMINEARNQAANNARPDGTVGSYNGFVYDSGQAPAKGDTIYVQLGSGESLWTVAQKLGLTPQQWAQLVADNPQFQNPDVIPEGAVVMVDVNLLPPETRTALQSAGAITSTGGAVTSDPQSAANAYVQGMNGMFTESGDPIDGAYSEEKSNALISDLEKNLSTMTPEQQRQTIDLILKSDAHSGKQTAVEKYLGILGVKNPGDVIIKYSGLTGDPQKFNQELEKDYPAHPSLSAEVIDKNTTIQQILRELYGIKAP